MVLSLQEKLNQIKLNMGVEEPSGWQKLTKLQPEEEYLFQKAYKDTATKMGLNLDPDNPLHYYDYRALWKETGKLKPDETGHFPSKYKLEGHPRMYVEGVKTKEELSLEDKLKQIKLNLQTTTEEAAPIEAPNLSLEEKLSKIKANIAPEQDVATPAPVTTPIKTPIGTGGQAIGGITLLGTKPLMEGLPISKPEEKPVFADINKSIPSIAKGVWYGIITLPQAIGSLMSQWGETEQVISDPTKFVSEPKWEGADKKIFEAMYGSRKLLNKQIGQTGKVVSEKGQELIKANQAFTEKYLPPADTTKLNKFLFELGSGASSIALAVGVSLVTGNAGAAAVAFGGIASGRTYQEAREAGVEPLKASALGAVNFTTEAGLEYLGLNFLLTKLPTSKLISLAAKGVENAGQEYLQEAGSNIVAKVGWDKARKWNEGSAKAGVMGFLLGAGADVVISSVVNETNAPKTFVKTIIDKTYSQMDTVTKSVNFENVVNQAKTDPEIKETIEEIKTAPVTEKPAGVEAPAPVTGKGKVSKIAVSIETKSIEQGLTKGYGHLAEYTPIVIKEQAQKATDLINSNIDEARRIIRGDKPLPEGLKGIALITAMEEHIKKTADGELASELANSPLVSGTSAAAQELRLAAERDPESPVKAIQDINKLLEERAGKRYPKQILTKAKESITNNIKNEIKKANTSQSWQQFILSIQC